MSAVAGEVATSVADPTLQAMEPVAVTTMGRGKGRGTKSAAVASSLSQVGVTADVVALDAQASNVAVAAVAQQSNAVLTVDPAPLEFASGILPINLESSSDSVPGVASEKIANEPQSPPTIANEPPSPPDFGKAASDDDSCSDAAVAAANVKASHVAKSSGVVSTPTEPSSSSSSVQPSPPRKRARSRSRGTRAHRNKPRASQPTRAARTERRSTSSSSRPRRRLKLREAPRRRRRICARDASRGRTRDASRGRTRRDASRGRTRSRPAALQPQLRPAFRFRSAQRSNLLLRERQSAAPCSGANQDPSAVAGEGSQVGVQPPPNFMVAEFVINALADAVDVRALLARAPAYVSVVVCETSDSAVAEMLTAVSNFQNSADAEDVANKDLSDAKLIVCCSPGVFVLAHTSHVSTCAILSRLSVDETSYCSVRCVLARNPLIAVAVGVLNSAPRGNMLPREILEFATRSIQSEHVRFLTGVFGDTRREMDLLCQECGAWFGAPVHQLWTLPNGSVWCYPAYIFVFGPADHLVRPVAEDTPDWMGFVGLAAPAAAAALDDSARNRGHEATFERGFLPQSRLPEWICPQPQQSRGFYLGACKQKKVDLSWWLAGVHQLVLWSGPSRPGRDRPSRVMYSLNRKGKQGKGKKGKGTKGKGKQEKGKN